MGLDTVELIIASEEKFGIKIPDKMAREMYTVGDLYHVIVQLLEVRDGDDSTGRQWSHDEVWPLLQQIVVDQLGVRKEDVTKEARFLEDLRAD